MRPFEQLPIDLSSTSYCEYKRHLLVYGPRLVQDPIYPIVHPTLKREHAEAIALEKILTVEREELVHHRNQLLAQAVVEKQNQLARVRSALNIIQRFVARIFQQKHNKRNFMSKKIAQWYRREARRRLENLLHLCQKFENLQAMKPEHPSVNKMSTYVLDNAPLSAIKTQHQGLVLQVLALRNLVSPISPLLCLHSTIRIELQLLDKTCDQSVRLETLPVPYSESLLEWGERNMINTDAVELQDIHNWTGVIRLFHTTQSSQPRCIGQVQVPVDLLQSPLATSQYCITRWFPLEKMTPLETVRGEIRISLFYHSPLVPIPPENEQKKDPPEPNASIKKSKSKARVMTDSLSPKNDVPPPVTKKDTVMPPPAPQPRPKQPYLKRKPYKVQFEQLDWSSVSAKTNSNLAKPKKPLAQVAKVMDDKAQPLGLSQYWNSSANPSNMKLELMRLKQKVELQTIFHRKSATSSIPSLTREQIQQLQLAQASATKYNALVSKMDEKFKQLKHQYTKGEAHHKP